MRAITYGGLTLIGGLFIVVNVAVAQPLGSFTWQLQPYCNRVTVNVRQDGAVYTLDGSDDQCGASQRAPLVGLATPNPDGSIGFGLNIISPTGQSIPVQARISISTLSGPWRDSGGNSGTFAFGGATPGLPPRPVPTAPGDITEVTAGTGLTGGGPAGAVTLAVDPAVVQSRVTTACPAGQALRSINQNGTALCEPITGSAGGDITAVNPGAGLTGGGDAGDLQLSVDFGGTGIAASVARSDHTHALIGTQNTAAGQGALANLTTGGANTAFGAGALGANGAGGLNVAVGSNALRFNTVGNSNVAIGNLSLFTNQSGAGNVAVGSETLRFTTTGSSNVAVGNQALRDNVGGSGNVAVGNVALRSNTSGTNDIAVGGALLNNTTGSFNVGVGNGALDGNVDGTHNVGVGQSALFNNTSGAHNVAVGAGAGNRVTTATYTTLLGDGANLAPGAGTLTNATAIGARAQVEQSHTIVLGSINGVNGATADTRVGIGTTTPSNSLEVVTDSSINNAQFTKYTSAASGFLAPLVGLQRARGSAAAPSAVVAGDGLGSVFFSGHSGSGFGGGASLRVEATQDWAAGVNGTRLRVFTTANGSGTQDEVLRIEQNGHVGIGTTTPSARLHVAGTAQIGETLQVDLLGAAGALPLCRNASNQIAACSSSLRYKDQVEAFTGGLDLVSRLGPISFTWKDGGARDVGFGAEDVAAIDPRLAVFNPDGTVEGVKYDRLTTVLVNAVKELEAELARVGAERDGLREAHAALERRLSALEQAFASVRR
jgi:hypothetical protein